MPNYEKAGADHAVDLLAQNKQLKAENKRLRTFVEYVASIDSSVVSDPYNENPLSMGELQNDAEKALKGK